MNDVEQLQRDLDKLGIYISPEAARKMINAGWKKRFEPSIQLVIPQTNNPIPDMRMTALNRMRNEH